MFNKRAFSIVELSIVLVVIGIIMGIGSVFFKSIFDYIVFKRCSEKLDDLKFQFEKLLPISNLSSLKDFLTSLEHRGKVAFSPFILKYYPDPCDYSPDLLPSFYRPLFLNEKSKTIFAIKYECSKKILEKYVSLSDIKKDLCENLSGADTAITYLKFEDYVTNDAFVDVTYIYPPNHRLKIISPQSVKIAKEGSFEGKLLLKEGVNLITFVLSSYGREVYRRNEYVLYTSLEPQTQIPDSILSVKMNKSDVKLLFKKGGEAFIAFDNTSYYIPDVEPNSEFIYPLIGKELKVYFKDISGMEHLFSLPLTPEREFPELKVSINEKDSSYEVKTSLVATEADNFECVVFENGKSLIETDNCDSLALEFDKNIPRLLTIMLLSSKSKIPLYQCDIIEDTEGMYLANCG